MILRNQRGNILFLILLAVILFAALSYAVTSSTRGGGKDLSDEKAELVASQMLNHMNQVKVGWDRLQLVKSCENNVIDFYVAGSDIYSASPFYPDATAPVDRRCSLFHPDGGGLTPNSLPKDAGILTTVQLPYYAQGYIPFRGYIHNVGRNYSSGTDYGASEIVYTAHFSSENVCKKFNNQTGLGLNNATPPASLNSMSFMSQGSLIDISGNSSIILRTNGQIAELAGVHAGCFRSEYVGTRYTAPHYIAYMVLHAG